MPNQDQQISKGNLPSDFAPLNPQGGLVLLEPKQLRPNPHNPRRLFDSSPLRELKESIRAHGVLVPITVYKLPAQEKYSIVDGERRYRCCVELATDGVPYIRIPAHVVEPPNPVASLIYMFNIHAFREQWELMPTALSLKQLLLNLGHGDGTDLNKAIIDELHELTGMSYPQLERCRKILTFPERFQQMSLDPDSKTRIPSNFWIELFPVLELSQAHAADIVAEEGRDGITDRFVAKYRKKKIKSVIHLRRVSEAFELTAEAGDDISVVADRLREFILEEEMETQTAFSEFIGDRKRFQSVLVSADRFVKDLEKAKIEFSVDGKDALIAKLSDVLTYIQNLIETLAGDDAPEDTEQDDTEETPI